MKKITLLSLAAVVAMASIGCTTTSNTNATVKTTNLNTNTAVVVNSNSALGVNTNAMSMNTNSSAPMTREEYDKNKDKYAQEAKSSGRTIGQGVEDGWLWTKTRADLLATNDLRESTINVDVSNAVVTLTGTVASKVQADKAVSVAKGVSGVKDVKSMLKVQPNDSMTNQMTGKSMTDGDKKTNTNANMKH
ncbi:MAG: BON domain-containing protein [Acidobacteriota bacterium]|nr:BON domain-containing protein [Acidobacteriota bacterium]